MSTLDQIASLQPVSTCSWLVCLRTTREMAGVTTISRSVSHLSKCIQYSIVTKIRDWSIASHATLNPLSISSLRFFQNGLLSLSKRRHGSNFTTRNLVSQSPRACVRHKTSRHPFHKTKWRNRIFCSFQLLFLRKNFFHRQFFVLFYFLWFYFRCIYMGMKSLSKSR